MIWKQPFTIEQLNNLNKNTCAEALGILITNVGDDFLEGQMPVSSSTIQPMGIIHGGANVVLAETLGSIASVLCLENIIDQQAVGLDINANHLKSVASGTVTARCYPVRIGRTVHVWQIDIRNDAEVLTCVSRLTVSIVPSRK